MRRPAGHRRGFRGSRREAPVRRQSILLAVLFILTQAGWILGAAAPVTAQDTATGRVEGVLQDDEGSPLPGVSVSFLKDGAVSRQIFTDADGRFAFPRVPAGDCTVVFRLGDDRTEEAVTVEAGETTTVELRVDWRFSVNESLTVYAASRRPERITEAPAAISVVPRELIEREAATGQLPKILESIPGAEITQSGLFDFKLNVRGVNGTINRRVAVLVDGRDPSFPILDTQEWYAVSFPLDELARAELVRGPSSALYGANAFNGVLDLTTRSAKETVGGFARLALGDLDTRRFEFRYAQPLGGDWYFKAVGGWHQSEDFTVSRTDSLEYSRPCTDVITTDCLFLEAVPLALDEDEIGFGQVRFEHHRDQRGVLVVEGGMSDSQGPVFATNVGRFQLIDVERPWLRVDYTTPRWSFLAYRNEREAEALTLAPGTPSFADSDRTAAEVQGWWSLADGRARLVAGAWFSHQEVDTADPQGNQTLLFQPTDSDEEAVYGQVDWELTDNLELVLAARWDDSSLHDSQVSPKASLVWGVAPNHTLRFGFNEAFQSPNFPEFFLRVPLAPPLDLSPFEAFCDPAGVDCGFGSPVELLTVGNDDLDVESIESWEVGWTGILANRAFVTLDVYDTEIEDFVQVLVPQVGTRLGRINPDFGAYTPPAALPAGLATALEEGLQAALGPLFFFLSNDPLSGDPIFVFSSIINFGRVETRGAELAVDLSLNRNWSLDFNYSWLDFEVQDELAQAPLEANGPENKFNLGVTYNGDRVSASAHYRWVDDFRWAEGILQGPVPSYEVVNTSGLYRFPRGWELGLNISNLFNDRHYEAFSGDILERRILGHVGFSW